jgi:starch synthase
LRILFVSSEVVPFSKTGGLADVAGSLPKSLRRLGHDVVVATPRYADVGVEKWDLETTLEDVAVDLAGVRRAFAVRRTDLPGSAVPIYFIEYNDFFDRKGLYAVNGVDYPDNAERMSFFSMAALETVKALGWKPDVIHANDWHTGLIPTYLKTLLAAEPFFSATATVFTVHNMGYQGNFQRDKFPATGLEWDQFNSERLEFYGSFNMMKGGLLDAEIVTTVSPTYAKEIQTEEMGHGLDGVLRKRAADLHGVLNGVDYEVWSPENDALIPRRYSPKDVAAGKKENKSALLAKLGLPDRGAPVIGMISRLADQKGFDILAEAFPGVLETGAQVVVLGTGDATYERLLATAQSAGNGNVSATIGFDNGLAHQIEAGSDMFLMPSRYEPCGLNQMYSLRYGTIPIVRKTGGLADSIANASDAAIAKGTATGFVFAPYTGKALLAAVKKAVKTFGNRRAWDSLVKSAMAQDFSWDASAKKYVALYQKAITARRGGGAGGGGGRRARAGKRA